MHLLSFAAHIFLFGRTPQVETIVSMFGSLCICTVSRTKVQFAFYSHHKQSAIVYVAQNMTMSFLPIPQKVDMNS